MLLSTLECVQENCLERLHGEADMWHVIARARDIGWTSSADEEFWWCPDHSEEALTAEQTWVVGCYTCDFEEGFAKEEDARYEYSNHECEADTWIWSPEQVREKEARRASRRKMETVTVNAALSDAAAKQDRIEEYANRWLRIRNLFLFWKREHI